MRKPTAATPARRPARSPAHADTSDQHKGGDGALHPSPPVKASEIENYTVALKYLSERTNVERTRPERVDPDAFKLDRMAALLDHLDNPQRDVKCVHIAGSKGKGSVVEMTAACLEACGYTTGVYTSPHLVDTRERVRIGAEMIGYVPFARLTQRVAQAGGAVRRKPGEPTFFRG